MRSGLFTSVAVPIRAGSEPGDAAEGVSTDSVRTIGGSSDAGSFSHATPALTAVAYHNKCRSLITLYVALKPISDALFNSPEALLQ